MLTNGLVLWLTNMQDAYETELARVVAANVLCARGYSLRAVAACLDVSHEWVRQHLVSNFVDIAVTNPLSLSMLDDSGRVVYTGGMAVTDVHTGGQ